MKDERKRVVRHLKQIKDEINAIRQILSEHDPDELFTDGSEAECELEGFGDWLQMEIDNAKHAD